MSIILRSNRTVQTEIPSSVRYSNFQSQVMEAVEKNASYFKEVRKFNYHPYYYVTLDKTVQFSENIQDMYKGLLQLIDFQGNGEKRIIYLYPFLVEDGDKAVVKIALLRPPSEKQGGPRDAHRMCQAALDASAPILQKIIAARKRRFLQVPLENSEHLIIKNIISNPDPNRELSQSRKLEIFPDSISFETELKKLLSTGFRLKSSSGRLANKQSGLETEEIFINVKPIPIPNAIQDWIKYLKDSESLTEVTENYHIIKDANSTEESRRHVLVHFAALTKVVLPRVHRVISDKGDKKNKDYTEAYKKFNSYNRGDIIEQSKLLVHLMNQAHLSEFQNHQLGLSVENIQRTIAILGGLLSILGSTDDLKVSELRRELIAKIKQNSQQKKLTKINLNEEMEKLEDPQFSNNYEFLHDFLEDLSESFAYYIPVKELSSSQDFRELHFVDASCLTAVIHNLGELALKNQSFLDEFQIAKKIKKSLVNDIKIHDELDCSLSPNQIEQAKKRIAEIEELLKQKDKKQSSLSSKIDVKKGIALSGIYLGFTTLMAVFIHPNLIVLALLYPILIKFIFSKNKKDETKEVSNQPTDDSLEANDYKSFYKYLESVDSNFTLHEVASRVLTSEQVKELLNLKNPLQRKILYQYFPSLKNVNESEIERRFRIALERNMAVVTFEGPELPSRNNYLEKKDMPFPDTLFIKKSDLRNPGFRRKLSNVYRGAFDMLMPIELKEQRYYRKLIELLENPREYTKYLRIGR